VPDMAESGRPPQARSAMASRSGYLPVSEHGLIGDLRLVNDPGLRLFDLAVAPNGNLVVSGEWPYGFPARGRACASTTPPPAGSSAYS
jgi:hypothetical protein